ncbi:hypothetical protein [Streptomyces sp. NPDC006307]|uniref:hypothetical protein n=1 Tax=Streptomyces sp. NPDC006307 TaxID=3156748 RepID=UPI00339E9BB0
MLLTKRVLRARVVRLPEAEGDSRTTRPGRRAPAVTGGTGGRDGPPGRRCRR